MATSSKKEKNKSKTCPMGTTPVFHSEEDAAETSKHSLLEKQRAKLPGLHYTDTTTCKDQHVFLTGTDTEKLNTQIDEN